MEPQTVAPTPSDTNDYNFILNPDKAQKGGLIGAGKDPFITKVILLVGGTLLVLGVLAFVINLVFGGKTNIDTIVALTQTQQELIRLSAQEKDAIDQPVKNAAVNTGLTLVSHQQKWLTYLDTHGKKLKKEELALKRDGTTDSKLKLAIQTSTFDKTYTAVMRAQLTTYAKSLEAAYKGTSNKTQRTQLGSEYKDIALLLKQWPAPPASQ